eukprot:symbB.v1.2.022182.t1/scaffold1915.1/size133927/10
MIPLNAWQSLEEQRPSQSTGSWNSWTLEMETLQARRLTDYTSGTLFKHFLLYQFCARCERDVETLRFSVEVERPILPPSLANARQKPGRRPQQTPENPEDGTGTSTEEKTAGGAGEDLSEEIQRIVEEKLRLTEARLEAKLAEREQQFMERLAKK